MVSIHAPVGGATLKSYTIDKKDTKQVFLRIYQNKIGRGKINVFINSNSLIYRQREETRFIA